MSDPTIAPCMSAYVAFLNERRAANTAKNARSACDLFLVCIGGDAPLSTMTKTRLDVFYRFCRETPGRHGIKRSLDTAAKYVSFVQLWWKWAANQDAFASTLPPPRVLEALPADAKKQTDAPTWAEMDAVVAAATSWYPLLLAVLRALGIRVSQALHLLVGDIRESDDGLELHFRGELGKSKQERAGRIVPIGAAVTWLFDMLKRGRDVAAWLIPTMQREGVARHARTDVVNGAWERAGVRAEVWRRRPDHAFRKGYTTCLTEDGADEKAVEFLVGHSLGLQGTYRARRGYPLAKTVALIPPFSAAASESILRALEVAT